MSSKSYTPHYALIQSSYWVLFMVLFMFSSVYLSYRGYSEIHIGIILAVSNSVAVIIQPRIASFVDTGKIRIRYMILIHMSIVVLSCIILFFEPENLILNAIILSICLITLLCVQPFLTTLCIMLSEKNYRLDYSVARGTSSIAFSVFSILVGIAVEQFSPKIIPVFAVMLSIVLSISVYSFKVSMLCVLKESDASDSNISFFKSYPRLKVFLFSIILILLGYTFFSNFPIYIIKNIGSGEKEMGIAMAIGAFLESPIIIFFTKIRKKFSLNKLLIFSSVLFSVKALLFYMAKDINTIYFAQAIQPLCFGIYLPTSIFYINEYVKDSHKAKAQAVLASSVTLSYVLSSLTGGWIIKNLSVSTMLLSGFIVSTIGTSLMILHLNAKKVSPKAHQKV